MLGKALEKAPPKSYLDAMAALMKWIEGVELLLESETDQANYLHVMEEQVSQYQVVFCMWIDIYLVTPAERINTETS